MNIMTLVLGGAALWLGRILLEIVLEFLSHLMANIAADGIGALIKAPFKRVRRR